MTTRQQPGPAAARLFAANDRINQLLIQHLDPAVWRAKPPGNVRTIAGIFTHMHNVRTKWIRLTAPHLTLPPQLKRAHCTPEQARAALATSSVACAQMLAEALGNTPGRITEFRRDAFAQPWPPGTEMLCYMLTHEAHHRGQVCMLTRQLGYPLPGKVTSALWTGKGLIRVSAPSL